MVSELEFGNNLRSNFLVFPEVTGDSGHFNATKVIEFGDRDNFNFETNIGVHTSKGGRIGALDDDTLGIAEDRENAFVDVVNGEGGRGGTTKEGCIDL